MRSPINQPTARNEVKISMQGNNKKKGGMVFDAPFLTCHQTRNHKIDRINMSANKDILRSKCRSLNYNLTCKGRKWGFNESSQKTTHLTKTNTHCRTPATPVQTEGADLSIESCISSPTDAAKETKDTT